MQVREEQHDHTQMIKFKGKRTKRQRLPSPLSLAMPSTSSGDGRSITDNSGGFDNIAITSPIASIDQFMNTTTEEEEDTANCLILLAQGHHHHHHTQKASPSQSQQQHVAAPRDHHENNNNKKLGLYLNYQCKTCNRCFPSFQALGGHRASHKKPNKANCTAQEKQPLVTYFDPTSTTLTLQMSNRALYGTSTRTNNTKCKVHECSICGAEFTSGQALGGHMRRHRSFLSTSTTTNSVNGANNIGVGESPNQSLEAKRPRNVLKLDLNLPAPEDDHRESKLPFQSKEKIIVFSATSLVDCHY